MIRILVVAVSFAACSTADTPSLTEALDEAGFAVAEGSLSFLDPADCCAPDARCPGVNPATPYGSVALPPAPDPDAGDPAPLTTHHRFHLRADEALVVLGNALPAMRYAGVQSYLFDRPDGSVVFGPIGPSQTELGAEPFAIVASLDPTVETAVVDALARSTDARPALLDRWAGPTLQPGPGPDADTFATILRLLPEEPDALAPFREAPGRALRVTPTTFVAAGERHPGLAEDPPPTDDESALADALDALEDAIVDAFAPLPRARRVSEPRLVPVPDCLTNGIGCFGVSTDAHYRRIDPFLLRADDFVVAFGVDHARAGRATYASVTVEDATTRAGIVDVSRFEGSARAFGVDEDALYAVVIARDCAPHPDRLCLEVPATCPGVPPDAPVTLRWRAYLDPERGTAPDPEALLADRAIYFNADPQGG